MKRFLVLAIALGSIAGLLSDARAAAGPAEKAKRPRIEVVFVLDTTGSMGGLIQGAKAKIWSIANTLAGTRPAPEIRMGLVGYRDRGDNYVTRRTDLTEDLDAVYADLMEFQAQGGGDTPESVNQALHEAVTQMKWSNDAATYRVIYLVGDCPPHMDYPDDVKYPETCQKAAAAGIIVNTIQCGDHAETVRLWRDIADRAEGAYFQVEQSGGAVAVATPFDERMAELSAALEGTRIYYGTATEREGLEKRAERARVTIAAAPVASAADRAAFMAGEAGKSSFTGRQELVDEVAEGKTKLEEVDEQLLPQEMRKMTLAQRAELVRKQAERRKELQEEIKKLQAQRRTYIEQALREKGVAEHDSFDGAILEAVREQAAKKGIVYEAGPAKEGE